MTRKFYENDQSLSEMITRVKAAEAESRFKDRYPYNNLWHAAPLFSVLDDRRVEVAYLEHFGAEFVYGEMPDYEEVKKVMLEIHHALIRCGV